MGWHQILYRPLLDLAAGRAVEAPRGQCLMLDQASALAASYPNGLTSGTSNFRWMAAAWWYVWALRYGSDRDRQDGQARVLELYADELKIGHQLHEQTAPAPHDNFHRMAHTVVRLGAREAVDNAVLEASGRWWSGRLALDEVGATPDGEVILPGCRGDGGPTTQVGTAIYRMFRGLPHLGSAKHENWWHDPTYGGGAPNVVRGLLAAGDNFGLSGKDDLPKLRLPMHVERSAVGHLLTLTGHPESEPIIDWVRVVYTRPGKHSVTFGKDWASPPAGARAGDDVVLLSLPSRGWSDHQSTPAGRLRSPSPTNRRG